MLAEAGTPESYQPAVRVTGSERVAGEVAWYPEPVKMQETDFLPINKVAPEDWLPANNNTNMDIVTYSDYVNGSIFSVPKDLSVEANDCNDSMLLTVYSFIKTFVSGSGAGQASIDNRIEQAMDLVKSHLMNAVRSEVEELKDKINKLEDTISHLSRENELLRSRASPETLQMVTGGASQPSQPPDPAKPPVQQH